MIILTHLRLGRIPFFLSDCQMVENMLITDHTFAMCTLTSLSVDEILLPRFVKYILAH